MAKFEVSNTSFLITGRKMVIDYTTDVILLNVQLSKDGINFTDAMSFSQFGAIFDLSSWENGNYSQCFLKGIFEGLEIIANIEKIEIKEKETKTLMVYLNKEPDGDEVVNVKSSDTKFATLDKTSLTFTPKNYSITQTVTVTGVHNANNDEDKNIDIVFYNENIDTKIIPTTIKNIDTLYGNIALSVSSLSVNEGNTKTFTVKLNSKPTNNQVVTLSTSNSNITLDKTSLTFTPTNYSTAQTITVTGVYNSIDENKTCTITASSPNVNNKTISVTVVNTDVYGNIVLSASSLSVNEGNTKTFTVKLDKAPSSNQVVTLSANNSNATINKTSLTFTPSNYSTAQTITVTGVHDDNNYRDKTCTITASSPNVNNKTVDITIVNIDISPENFGNIVLSASSLSVNEKNTKTFTVKLDSSPTNNQIITLSTSNSNVTLDKTSLIFTPSNYSTAQTVTVTGAHDSGYDNKSSIITASNPNIDNKTINVTIVNIDKRTYTVKNNLTNCKNNISSTSVTEGNSYVATITANPGYFLNSIAVTMGGTDITSSVVSNSSINIPNITGNIVITAIANPILYGDIVLNVSSLSIEEGNTKTFTVKLDSKPTYDQVITLSSNNSNITLDKTSLTFTPSNYSSTQTVTVTGIHDEGNYEDKSSMITASSPNVDNKTINVTIVNIDVGIEIPMTNGYLSSSGSFISGDSRKLKSDYVDVSEYSQVVLKNISAKNIRFCLYVIYDENKNRSTYKTISNINEVTITTNGKKYIAFYVEFEDYSVMNPTDIKIVMIGS